MNIDFTQAHWINAPQRSQVTVDSVEIVTEPNTDFWQRSYYGFRNDNAPALLVESADNFTFTAKAAFEYQQQFDQCGLIIYLDSDNWFKVCVEYEDASFSRLGSIVTNLGYSDWATSDIEAPASIWYRLSRRGPDFLIESSLDGQVFQQMRIFHLHLLGETTADMGKSNPPLPADKAVRFGLFACSPNPSSFTARFSDFKLEDCCWMAHGTG
jgi:regulation of enolase protein 1 (concanavalin A-like superfamily)